MAARWRRCIASPVCICRAPVQGRGASTLRWKRLEGAAMDAFNRTLARYEPMVLGIFRIMVGPVLLHSGVAKILKFRVLPYFANIPPLIATAGWLELVLGVLLIVGLFTRPVAFILSGEMAFAYFIGHMFKAGLNAPVYTPLLNGGKPAILFCFACLYLAVAGGGPWSVDAMMRQRRAGLAHG